MGIINEVVGDWIKLKFLTITLDITEGQKRNGEVQGTLCGGGSNTHEL